MTIPGTSTEFTLPDWEARSVDVRGRGVEVTCLAGELLITCEGDPDDHVLAAGGTFVARRKGRLAIAALRPSRVLVRHVERELAASGRQGASPALAATSGR
jgi:hypothetical protein